MMNSAEKTLQQLTPELLNILANSPEYGAIGINVTLHDGHPVRIDSSRTVTMKISKEVKND